jgi:hypothetical protein
VALWPGSKSSAIVSRYDSLIPAERLPACSGDAFANKKPVVTEVAAFERDFGPHVPGERTTIPADRK